jgi:transaldolase
MKIFLDSADLDAIRKASATGLLDGVTTNPTMAAQQSRSFDDLIAEICALTAGPVSAEAVADSTDDLVREGVRLAGLAPNVVVKVPMTPDGLRAAHLLERREGIRANVTMVFSPTQALLAMKTGASYVSLVLSRLDAIAAESDILVQDTMAVQRAYGFPSEIIGASLKTQNHLLTCLRAGVDIATVPEALFLQMFSHPLTESGLAQFAHDWERLAGRQGGT